MPTAHTLTGNVPIGYRWIGGEWQKDFDAVVNWTRENGFASIDLPSSHVGEIKRMVKGGLKPVSVDIAAWGGYQALLSSDKAKRTEAVEKARGVIEQGAEAGAKIIFTLMLPEKPDLPRTENFKFMVESYKTLAAVAEKAGVKIVIEGWPGPGALCCTPETYRAALKEIASPAVGVNYDPSHLLRMGIDPMRFLAEFAKQIYHVHGKDTELNGENLYEFGHEQPATFAPGQGFGAWAWRYTIPGHGQARWPAIFEKLAKAGYGGMVSVELEDARFNGSEKGEKLGLVKSREYLEGC
jgi:sugar phosphate isomerase/epimerase